MAEATIKNWKPSYRSSQERIGPTDSLSGQFPEASAGAQKNISRRQESVGGSTIKNWKPSYGDTAVQRPVSNQGAITEWRPSYQGRAGEFQDNVAPQDQANDDFQQKVGRFAGIRGFEGEPRTDNVLENAKLDLAELGDAYKTIAGLVADDFKSGNYTKTLGAMVKNFPEAVVSSYSRWVDAAEQGKLGEAITKYPLQFAQDVSLPLTFFLGGTGAALKAAGATGRVAKAVQTMGKLANVVEVATDPFVGVPSLVGQKLVGRAFRRTTGKTPRSVVDELPTSLEKESLQKVLEEKGYTNASKLADDVLDNPDLLKDPDLYSDYVKAQKRLLPDDIDFDKAAQEILDLDLDTTPTSKKYIVNTNIRRLHTTHEMDNLIGAVADKLQKQKSPPRTWDRVDQLADAIGMTPDDLLKVKERKALNSYQIEAARRINQQALLNLYSAKNIAKQAPTPENLIKFDHALRLYGATFDKMSGITTEAGRALQIFNKVPKVEKMKQKAIRELIDRHGGTQKIEETMRLMDDLNDEQLSVFVRKSLEATNWDKFREAWMSSMLSGPTTHVVNAGSNALTSTYAQVFESIATSAYSEAANAVRRITGKSTTPIKFSETVGRIRGMARGLVAGAEAFKDNFTKGETFGIMLPIEYRRNAIGGKLGSAIRTPLKLLESSDSFFKALNYTSELEGLAVRDGVKKGLKGKELSAYVKETVTNPPDGLVDAAMKVSEKNTFTNKLGGDWLTESGKWIMAGRNNKYFGKPLQLVIPFVRTPTNIMKYALERTPLGLTFSDVRQAIKAGGVARDQAISRIALGSALGFYIVNQVEDGKVTGALSSDRNKRNTQRATGMQPYSFKVGDNYYSYQRLEPLGSIIGLSADFKQLYDLLSGPETEANRKDIEKIPALISASIAQNVLNKTYMQGLSGLVAAMDDPDRYFQKFYANIASTSVPTIVAQYARSEDPYLREAKTTMEKIKSRIPRLRETLPYRFNIWGDPIKIETENSLVNPIYKATDKKDKATNELLRLGLFPTMPRDEMTIAGNKIKLDKYQYEELLSHGRKQAKKIIDGYVNSPEWDARPDIDKREIIEKIIRAYDSRARKIVYKIATRYQQ